MELLLPQQMYGRIIGTKSVARRKFKMLKSYINPINEKVTIYGKEYLLICQPPQNPETGSVSFIAECESRKVLIDCKILDPDDPECYDIETPDLIIDMDSGKIIYP
jgi:hypothetical protein